MTFEAFANATEPFQIRTSMPRTSLIGAQQSRSHWTAEVQEMLRGADRVMQLLQNRLFLVNVICIKTKEKLPCAGLFVETS